MKHITGYDRNQAVLIPVTIDAVIAKDSLVRLIDIFVDSLDLSEMGFTNLRPPSDGRPPYHPADLLKLYIYGYMNRYRSSRMLETETKRNIELMWLLKGLTPDHNTIANFRRDNPKAIKKVFRQTVTIAKHHNLIGGVLIAGDSTRLRAQNSKKNNYNEKKIKRHIEYIDRKLEEFNKVLEEADGDYEKAEINKEIQKHNTRKSNYKNLEKQLKESGEKQISTSDPESRQLMVRNNITEVGYNVQTTTDAKHNIPIDYQVTNRNDSKAMGQMVRRAKTIIRKNDFTVLYDKGYHTGSELEIAQKLGLKTLVAIPSPASNAPDPKYNVQHFAYNLAKDYYTCPEGNHLTTNGNIYIKHRGHSNETRFRQYRTKACKSCQVRDHCTTAKNGKLIERNIFTPVFELNRKNIEANPDLYRQRQQIVEHPYGTIKRQWGFDHILTKRGMNRAEADVGFMFIAYNLRRILTILGQKELKKWLKEAFQIFLPKSAFKNLLKPILSLEKLEKCLDFSELHNSLESLILVQNIIKLTGF